MDADALFKAAPRRRSIEKVGELEVEVFEMTTFQRLEIAEFMKDKPKAKDLMFAEVLRRACPVFKSKDAATIVDQLSPKVLDQLASRAIELAAMAEKPEKKSPGVIANVSSIG